MVRVGRQCHFRCRGTVLCRIVGELSEVSLDQSADAWKEAIKKLNITWPQMSDLKYWNCEGAQLYAVSSIPHTVLIDGEGTILARGLHGDELQEKIAEAVK